MMSSSTAKLGEMNNPNIVPSLAPIAPALRPVDDQRVRNFELVNSLQATLNLEEQLGIFKQWLLDSVDLSGFEYRHNQQQLAFSFGDKGIHRCSYNLVTDEENLGEIEFSRTQRFSEEELSTIETALTALLFPVRNALRYHEALQTALRDPLTGTGNRIALDNALRRECQLAERYAQSFSLLVLDIDHFKKINDNHGHSVGDSVLQQVAKRIRHVTRETDMTFRYGGEEFVVVLSKTDGDEATVVAERIRQAITDKAFTTECGDIEVSISIGASSLRKQDKVTELFDRADEALYLAKNNGRNCVIAI